MNVTYEYRKAHGICTKCGKNPAEAGHNMCAACVIRHREEMKARNYELEARGICIQCGKRPAVDGHILCAECAASKRIIAKRCIDRRKARGLCTHCGKSPATHGLLCTECWSTHHGAPFFKRRDEIEAMRREERENRREARKNIPSKDSVRNNDPMLTEQQRCYTCRIPMKYCTGNFKGCYRAYCAAIRRGEERWNCT